MKESICLEVAPGLSDHPADRELITEFIKEVSPLLPNPWHFQDYDRSMLYPAQPGSEGCGGGCSVGRKPPQLEFGGVRALEGPNAG